MSLVVETIDHEARRIYSRGDGEITLQILATHMLNRLDPTIAAYGELLDITNATTSMSEQDIHELAALRKTISLPFEAGPTAVVATNQVFYGMFRMYEMITDQIRPIMVFRDIESARKWLDEVGQLSP